MAARKERRYAAVSVLRCAFQVRLRGPCEGLHFGICRTSWIQPCALRLVAFANRDSALQSCRLTAFVHSLLLTFGLSLTISPALSEKSQQPPVCRVNEAPATPKVVFQKRNRRRGDHDQRLTYRMPTSEGDSSTAASGQRRRFERRPTFTDLRRGTESYPAPEPGAGAGLSGAPPTETGPKGLGSGEIIFRDVRTRARVFECGMLEVVKGVTALCRASACAASEES